MNLTKSQHLVYDMEKLAGGTISVICGSMLLDGKKPQSELLTAANELFQLNDALRIRICKSNGAVSQIITEYADQDIEVLHFKSKAELDSYAQKFAQIPLDLHGVLCEIKVIIMPDQYGLLVKLHHLISDAWTLALMGNQFNALLRGVTPPAYSYAEYIESEHTYVQSSRYIKDRNYFVDQFRKCDEVTYLSEKQIHSYAAARKSFVIDSVQTKQIADYAVQNGTSAFMLFTTALAIYMNRTKMNTEKFYVGTVVLNRNGVREKNTMGMFVNTVPMLIELDNKESFSENVSQIMKTAFSVFRHQKFNYGDVLACLRQEYSFSEKLYDVILSYQNATITGDGIETTWYPCGMQTESLQIHIDDRDNEGIFRIHYDYLTEKFSEHDIEMLHSHLVNLLLDGIAHDGKRIYELNLLSADERKKILTDFNNTAVEYPRDKCVHQLFEQQVIKHPGRTALIACDETLTYEQLNTKANRIAHSLIEQGIKVGDIVAFALPRTSNLIAAMIGILKTGAAYLPIDPEYPQERIDYMLADSHSKYFITERNIGLLLSSPHTENPAISNSSEKVCYCIYTSGSTGTPKAVAIKHDNVHNFIRSEYSQLQNAVICNCDCIFATNSVVFDITVQDILLPLLNGLFVLLSKNESMSKVESMLEYAPIKRSGLIITPTKLQMYLQSQIFRENLHRFSVIMVGAESFPGTLFTELRRYTDAMIFNGYGPTETTCGVLYAPIENADDVTIGKPIANTQIYIVDQYMQVTPVGVIGELCIAGDGVGAGYLNSPELTAEKFIDNPFGEGTLYKTGDLAYWREDGNIVYVGRNDFQVKIRGLRIELGEIENAIDGIDGISQAVVTVRKNSEGRQLICAFYTGTELEAKDIRAKIGKKLPKYMLPHIITHLDNMPLTTSGKVNRKALPEVDLNAIDTAVEYIAPQTTEEKALVTAVISVLGVEKVSLLDNFFDLGGDSLKVIELIAKLEAQNYQTDTKTIFDCETIRELAQKLTLNEGADEAFDFTGDIPATDAQMRVYTAQGMHSDSTTYNVPYVFRVDSLDAKKLQNAIDALILRHDILRTHFENKDGCIIQVIDDSAVCAVEKLDTDEIAAFIRPFDLTKAPLLRVGYHGNTVMIDMHHIITDGGSMPIFLRELNELYMGRTLQSIPISYKQFAVQKQDHTASEEYWLSVFHDELPVLEINTDFKRGQKQSFSGNAVYDSIDGDLHRKIVAKCKKLNITPYVFYMGAFNVLLSKFSGNEDTVVGMPISGRNSKFLNTIGMFVNTIALRNQPKGKKTVRAFLEEVKSNSVDAISHQDYPYGELVKKLNANTPGRNPLFDVVFAYQSEQMTDVIFGDKRAELLPIPVTSSKYDFTFNIMPQVDAAVVMVEYCTDLFRESTIQRLLNSYKHILEQMLDETAKLKEISAVTEEDSSRILHDFNSTALDYPRDKCVHQLFEEQVERIPENTAVIACDRTLTFAELNEQANRIAHSLIKLNIGSGDIVAIKLPRRSYLFSTMLGVLKASAAYMPIDPDYPQDRIEYMLQESRAKYCIDAENVNILLSGVNTSNPICSINGEDIFCALHTSGSTGKPKMATLKHSGLSNFIAANKRFWMGIDTVVSATIITFDAFVMDSVLSVAQGYKVVLASEEAIYNQTKFEELFIHSERNMFFSTPTKIESYIENSATKQFISQIGSFVIGGEVFTEHLLKLISTYATESNIYNIYGPTETTICALVDELDTSKEITIGKPIANTQIYIVDQYMQASPVGVIGELSIAGDGVGAGYLNRPELTAEKFIDNPFGQGKLYKTGDRAYWQEDGNIVYVGRNDFQVKIRGLRIELGEIENILCKVEGITHAVVVVRKNSAGRQLICAFYSGTEINTKEIRNQIGQHLPKYMIPHIFTYLTEMPLTTSGKVNRKSLPEIDLENIINEQEYIAPVTNMQKELCKLLEVVLGITPIGLADNFFDMGGDSLKAIEFVSKAHNEGIYFNLQNVFDYPTVGELSECIENGDKQTVSFADVDFTGVDGILSKNTIEAMVIPEKKPIGDILLAGATGYLGIHILANYLEHDTGIAYCLVRGKDTEDSIHRLKALLSFYFGSNYADIQRIKVVCADLQKDRFGLSQQEYDALLTKVDMVINAAASVKHYGSYQYFYEANVETTKRLIDFCKLSGAKLIHTSTLSVSGNGFGDQFDGYVSETEKHFYESSLYIGQPLDNVYARSKFEAEKAVLDAMTEGLHANIMRMGNLTNRLSDGVFQKNHESNAFTNRVMSVLELGLFPDYLLKLYAEFTPIDEAANAIMTIARHFSTDHTVFHINSTKVIYMDALREYFNALGFGLKIVSGEEFTEALRQTAKQTGTEHIFETFINDMDENDQLNYDSNIRIQNDFTEHYLKLLGFTWSDLGFNYLKKYVAYFEAIGYWEDKC